MRMLNTTIDNRLDCEASVGQDEIGRLMAPNLKPWQMSKTPNGQKVGDVFYVGESDYPVKAEKPLDSS
jgi:hypothetical protein